MLLVLCMVEKEEEKGTVSAPKVPSLGLKRGKIPKQMLVTLCLMKVISVMCCFVDHTMYSIRSFQKRSMYCTIPTEEVNLSSAEAGSRNVFRFEKGRGLSDMLMQNCSEGCKHCKTPTVHI